MRFKILSLLTVILLVSACAAEDSRSVGVNTSSGVAGRATSGSVADFEQNVGDRIFFGFDRYDLTPEARAVLDRQSSWLQQYQAVRVTIEGHCDERGTREYNLALGERRANSVRNYLQARGLVGNRISIISYGKERPAIPGHAETAWSQNRRGVTVLTAGAPAS
jgi:peptidoglycan-associated lipoprotein